MEVEPEKRRRLVWEVERRLAQDVSRSVLLYSQFATCMQPRLEGPTTITNSRFNGWRMEDVWLDKWPLRQPVRSPASLTTRAAY
jgi:peptide/nickel transport system substrate-binding protein